MKIELYDVFDLSYDFCQNCGQAIDWCDMGYTE